MYLIKGSFNRKLNGKSEYGMFSEISYESLELVSLYAQEADENQSYHVIN